MKEKKPFKQTRIGKFLLNKAPSLAGDILSVAGDITGVEILKNIGSKIKRSEELTPIDKEQAMQLLDMDIKEMEEVSKRWLADMNSDSWMSKNVRPMTLIYLLVIFTVLVIGDSIDNGFHVEEAWKKIIESLLITVFIAYFGSRGIEKYKKLGK